MEAHPIKLPDEIFTVRKGDVIWITASSLVTRNIWTVGLIILRHSTRCASEMGALRVNL